jgi:hypothetical protein
MWTTSDLSPKVPAYQIQIQTQTPTMKRKSDLDLSTTFLTTKFVIAFNMASDFISLDLSPTPGTNMGLGIGKSFDL